MKNGWGKRWVFGIICFMSETNKHLTIAPHQLAWLCAVARCASFRRAAEQLDVPVSSLSRHIAQIERDLGVRLFQRTTRQVRLTQAGARLLAALEQPLKDIGVALADVKNSNAEVAGTVRMSTTHFLAETLLPTILASLLHKHPRLRLELVLDENVIDVRAHGLDLVLRVGNIKDQSLIGRKIAEATFHKYAAPQCLLQKHMPHLAYADEAMDDAVQLISGNMRLNYLAALAGAGSVYLPRALCVDDVAEGRLVQLSDEPVACYPIYLLYPSREYMPHKVQAVLDEMYQHYPALQIY